MNDTTTNDNNNNNDNEQQQHDNSATLPRSNISSPQHSAKPNQQQSALSQNISTNNNSNSKIVEGKASSPAVVELSSLFQTESTLFRDESQHSSASELLVNREQKRRSKYNTESELDTDQSELDIIINNNRSEDSEESQLEMANIYLMKEEPPVEKLRKNSSEHLLPVTSSSATLTSSNITNIINENKLHSQRKQQQQNPNIWNNIRGSFKLNNNTSTSSSSGLGGIGGGGQKQKTIYNSITGGLGLDGSSLHTNLSNLGSIREEGSDEEDEDPLMEVMDYLEDEIDEHTYDDLIPLQIRMALEDQVFGWDHFLSNILGHVGFTVGSYLLTFWMITFVVLREVPWGHYEHDDDSTVRTNSPWGMPHELFSFIRTALSLGSAISTFRTIRRRRRVWLRQPYGASSHVAGSREFQRHQSSLEEADRRAQRFVLGSKLWSKMQRSYTKRRNKYLARGVHKKLLKAQRMFERRHRNRVELIRSTSASSLINSVSSSISGLRGKKQRAVASALTRDGHETSHHERVRMLATLTPTTAATRKRLDSADVSLADDDTAATGSVGGSSVGDLTSDYNFVPPGQYAMDSHTLPNFAMESVSHDQMPFAHGEIKKVPYVHGGFFGAAPFMLTNPHWIAILRILMPDVYVEISRRASYAPAPRLIHWAENNPVVAAYGTAHEIEFSGRVPTLEWDVFLDPYLVRRVEIVLSEKEAFLERQKDARKRAREAKESAGGEDNHFSDEEDVTPVSASDERLVLSYYDKEIKRRTTLLVERMLIAHGNIVQLVMEHFCTSSYLKKYNFSRVKRTRKTLGGGIYARQWLSVYSEAMKLGMGYDEDDDGMDDDVSDSGTDGSQTDGSIEELDFANFSEMKDDREDHREVIDSKSVPNSFNTPVRGRSADELGGPPRRIIMTRNDNNDSDDGSDDEGMLTDGDVSINSEPSPGKLPSGPRRTTPRRRRRRQRHGGGGGGANSRPTTPLAHEQDNVVRSKEITSLNMASIVPDKSMAESISILKPIMQCSAPFGLVLDIKSRHISRRVWALVIDYLRDCGARVEGIASFIVEEVRDITQYCSSSVNEIVFIHSAGDLQHGCHSGQIRRGDKVFFNAGSLLWDYPNVYDADALKNMIAHRFTPCFDEQGIKLGYRLKPYAKIIKSSRSPKNQQQLFSESESETCDESTLDDGESTDTLFAKLLIADTKKKSLSEMDFVYEDAPDGICSTIQQYKEHYQLSIGLYVQEFAIDEVAISLIVKYANHNQHVYDLGLSWGGVNGLTVKGIQPGRFTATDGLWNQRYGGMPWQTKLQPGVTPNRENLSGAFPAAWVLMSRQRQDMNTWLNTNSN